MPRVRHRKTLDRQGAVRRVLCAAVVCWLIAVFQIHQLQAETYALLIGINRYTHVPADFQPLEGAVNDVKNFRQMLIREYGVPEGNICVLTDEGASLAAIRQQFRDLSRRVGKDDHFVFHFSGHGTQLADDDGDESAAEAGDTLDEALCPYDCGRDLRGALRDDELGRLLDQIQAAEVVVILDACHSGTATKGLLRAGRARAWPYSAPSIPVAVRGAKALPIGRDLDGANGAAGRIVITACTAEQVANELEHGDAGRGVVTGMLTHFLVTGLRGPADSNGNGIVTYAEAHGFAQRRIDESFNGPLSQFKERQTTVLEPSTPARADNPVFGATRKRPMYAKLVAIADRTCTLDLGVIHGLRPDQVLGVYEPGDGPLSQWKILGKVRVRQQGLQSESAVASILEGSFTTAHVAAPLTNPLASPRLLLATGVESANEGVAPQYAQQMQAAINRELAEIPQIRIDASRYWDLRLVIRQKLVTARSIQLQFQFFASNGQAFPPSARTLDTPLLESVIEQETKAFVAAARHVFDELTNRHALARLVNPAPGFGLQLALGRRPAKDGDLPVFVAGDSLPLGLKASADCFYYVIALRPDGEAKLLRPAEGQPHGAPRDKPLLLRGPGREVVIDGPPGVYLIKLIAFRDEVPLDVFREGLPDPKRIANLPPEQWAETSLAFRVVAREEE